jgi:predicted exporter
MTRAGVRGTVGFVLLALVAAVIAARARYSADLSALLPEHPSAPQRALIEQLRTGPAARLIIAAIGGADAATRAQVSVQLAQALRANPQFVSASNGDGATLAREREFLFTHRYLLSPAVTAQRFSVAGLHAAVAASLEALASPEGPLVKPLFARDPTGELLTIVEALGPERAPRTVEGVWSSRDGAAALLLVETRAEGSDTDAQQRAVQSVRAAFARARTSFPAASGASLTLTLSGPPVFAVAARALIIREVMRLSVLSSALIALLLLCVYRSLPALILGLVPVAAGALAGVAAVALGRALMPIASLSSGDLPAEAVRTVRAAVAHAGVPAVLLDLKGETDRLYADYLTQAIRLSLAGLAAIVLLLLIALRSPTRVARVLAPLVLAVAAVTALLVGFGQPLTILHLVGLLLTVAVGSNYALFFDRRSHDPAGGSLALTLASLAIANLATVLAFGVLASSRLPMLADLGAAVAPGAFLALLFSAMLSKPAAAEGCA